MIGGQIAADLMRNGYSVAAIGRRFTRGQRQTFGEAAIECPLVALDAPGLTQLLDGADVVINCVGVLQGGGGDSAEEANCRFVRRLLQVASAEARPVLLIHVSIPGEPEGDATGFSRSKRAADDLIAQSTARYLILRPGFVIAPVAYGGGALMRALATTPLRLSAGYEGMPFQAVDIADITATVRVVVRRWRAGENEWASIWDVLERSPSSVGDVVEGFRRWLGGPKPLVRAPAWLMDMGAKAGDLATHLGWRPPIRTTALRELRRGVRGDPEPWIAATNIEPRSLSEALAALPASVQEKWFARLFLLKALLLLVLAAFWVASGLVALTAGFGHAATVLTSHGFPSMLARCVTIVTSLSDLAIGVAIAFRRTCRLALRAGIGLSLGYLLAAVVFVPELWIDPLGPLLKVPPLIVLMAFALAILEDR
jgi:uncharacterized protein YbjT (DUF2867 family)